MKISHPSEAMPTNTLGQRIDARLDALGMHAEEACRYANIGKDTIRNIHRTEEAGRKHNPRMDTIIALARVLKTTPHWLMTGDGDFKPGHIESDALDTGGKPHIDSSDLATTIGNGTPKRMVKLKGYVGAGSEAHYYNLSDDEFEEVEAFPGASDSSVAVEIRGKSFGPLMDGWLVHYEDVRSPITEDLFGKICVVGLADDRILLKTIKRERDGSFTLLSNSTDPPIHDAEIEWAAEVIGFKPR